MEKANNPDDSQSVHLDKTIETSLLILNFLSKEIIPLLPKKIIKDKNSALVLTYNRIYLNFNTLCSLRNPFHYQTTASIARSIFELYLDLSDLYSSESNSSKFFDWSDLEFYRFLKNAKKFNEKNTDDKIILEDWLFQNFEDLLKAEKELLEKNWDKNQGVRHWTGMDIKQRVEGKDISVKKMYVKTYKLFSWLVHSGVLLSASITQTPKESYLILSHTFSQTIILGSTLNMNEIFKFDNTLKNFHEKIEEISNFNNSTPTN